MNNDDDLRQLFQDATADIRPHGTLDDIRAQTKKVDPMARRWFLPSLAAAAAMALVIGGAFWMTRDDDSPGATPATSPSATVSATDDPTTGTPPTTAPAKIYYVGEGARGPRLFAETHTLEPSAVAAVNEAMTGTPSDSDYKTYWPAGVTIEHVSFDGVGDGGTITIRVPDASVADRPAGVSAKQAAAQVDAIVRTAQVAMRATKAQVEFYVGTTRLPAILGVTGPTFIGGSDDDVLALVSIDNLVDGATVKAGNLTVTGVANAFEAAYTWEILVGGDAVIDSGFGTAAECCKLAPYSFTTNIALEPGTYTVVVHDNDESGQGRPVNRDTKEIVVE